MGWGNESLFKWSRSYDQEGLLAHIWLKHEKFFFPVTKRLMTIKVDMQPGVLGCYQVYSNDNTGLTLTYFIVRSNFVPYAFLWEKR